MKRLNESQYQKKTGQVNLKNERVNERISKTINHDLDTNSVSPPKKNIWGNNIDSQANLSVDTRRKNT
jgi:hypothetical protein